MARRAAWLLGGLQKPAQKALPGFKGALEVRNVLDLLRADLDYVTTAATVDQHAALTGRSTHTAVWRDTPEGREQQTRDRRCRR